MRPPIPVPMITALRAGSAPMSPASASASAAAPKPSWVTRSTRRASLAPRYAVGSKSRTSQPKRTGSGSGSKRVIVAAMDWPAMSVDQNVSRSLPAGVFTPMPVTATRTRPRLSVLTRSVDLRKNEVDGLADRRHTFEIFLGHFDVEALLEAHYQF